MYTFICTHLYIHIKLLYLQEVKGGHVPIYIGYSLYIGYSSLIYVLMTIYMYISIYYIL